MTDEFWISIVTTIVVPIVLKVLVHYFPWLADAVTPEQKTPRQPSPDDVSASKEYPQQTLDQAADAPPSGTEA